MSGAGRRRGPQPLSEILGALMEVRGYGRVKQRHDLDAAWARAAGEPACRHSRPASFRRGVLTITVAHSTLLEELSAYRKADLLTALRRELSHMSIQDLRFRVGPLDD